MGNWMGNWFCRLPNLRIIIGGLDAAGKTTLLYKMKLGEIVTTIPTIGFNVETLKVDGLEFTCWDVGGRDKARPLIRHYLKDTKGCVYVVDSSDKERLAESLDELRQFILVEDETREAVVMVLANKQDREGALSAEDIENALTPMVPCNSQQTIFVMPCSATAGEGIHEAFSYFATQLCLNSQEKAKHGLITIKERLAEMEMEKDRKSEDSAATYKLLFKNPVGYLKHLFY